MVGFTIRHNLPFRHRHTVCSGRVFLDDLAESKITTWRDTMKRSVMAALLAVLVSTTVADARPRKHRHHQATDTTIVAHPAGCPRTLFCGCGVSVRVFGRPIRSLYLASNYGYYFNQTSFRPGVVAYRSGHAVYVTGGTVANATVYDPNSGRHLTRIHSRDLSRYRFVDPHSQRRRIAGLTPVMGTTYDW